MMANAKNDQPLSSGVDALIAKLKNDGVSAGRAEADAIVANAKAEAETLAAKAKTDASAQVAAARKEADALLSAGKEAIKTAMRDAVLDMKTRLMDRFRADVQRLVSNHMEEPELIKEMILAVAGRAGTRTGHADEDQLEIILPSSVVGLEDLRNDPQELSQGRLSGFVLGLTREVLNEGVTFSASDDISTGIRVQVKDKDIEIDLSDQAVAGLLLQHLQPRFRAILEGIVK